MAQHGKWEERPWETGERGRHEERWRGEGRRSEPEPRGWDPEEERSARDEWRGEPRRYGGDPWRREWRGPESEERPLAGTRDVSRGYGDREREWERRYGTRPGAAWDPYGAYEPQERWGGYRGERGEHRPEVDPPWVERGPEARRRGETRGLVEWEDRGPLKWLGDKFREATGRPSRGPKGYTRSDERISDDVCERIARSGVDADEVEVKVENREVTLTGTVGSRAEKWRLEEVAEDVFGVEDVHNHLRVSRVASSGRTEPGTIEDPSLRH